MENFWNLMEIGIDTALKLGADFVEARGESINRLLINFENDIIKDINRSTLCGIGFTVIYKGARGYGFTTSQDSNSIKDAAESAFKQARAATILSEISSAPVDYTPKEYSGKKPNIMKHPKDFDIEYKIELAKKGIDETLKENVVNLRAIYGELWGQKYFLNSEGLKRFWEPIMVGLFYLHVVRKNGNIGNSREQISASMGLELFDTKKPENIAKTSLRGAHEAAKAKTLKSGKYPAVADPDFAGVLAHESFGHLTEGDYVATKASILAGRLGQKIGSEHANVMESGDPVNYGFWIPYDDEGVDTKTVQLLKDGVLVGYLHARSTAKIMNMEPTGNARAINYRFPPIVRMRNTYFGGGDMSKEEVFELIKEGVYAEGSGGGQVEDTGTFTFGANRAYWVKNGEIRYPLKGVVMRGHILDFIKNIIGASKEVFVKTSILGGCGKGGQAPLPVGLGGPYLAVKEAIIGGGA
ncbi:MAG: TldD/PmbA family protein [Candidatus Njordarchaeia archaeon]